MTVFLVYDIELTAAREAITAYNQAIWSQEIESMGENVISVIANQKKIYGRLEAVQAAAGEQQLPASRGAPLSVLWVGKTTAWHL